MKIVCIRKVRFCQSYFSILFGIISSTDAIASFLEIDIACSSWDLRLWTDWNSVS